MNKFEIRQKAKEIRKTLDIERISDEIISNTEKISEFQNSRHIMFFYPKTGEINLLKLYIKYQDKKKFYLPKMCGENLVVCPYDKETTLETVKFGISEPCSNPVEPDIIDFAIIPCLCADKNGYRIGYGGGFYDRFIPQLKKSCPKAIPIAQELLFDKVPAETHDIPANFIITERNLIRL